MWGKGRVKGREEFRGFEKVLFVLQQAIREVVL